MKGEEETVRGRRNGFGKDTAGILQYSPFSPCKEPSALSSHYIQWRAIWSSFIFFFLFLRVLFSNSFPNKTSTTRFGSFHYKVGDPAGSRPRCSFPRLPPAYTQNFRAILSAKILRGRISPLKPLVFLLESSTWLQIGG